MKKKHFPLLLLTALAVCVCVNSQGLSNGGDASVMFALKKSLSIPDEFGWTDPDVCKWSHVQCSDGRVTRIQIKDQSFKGTLPSDLRNLSSLQDLELQGNQISGPLPTLSGLNSLQTLLLSGNNFSTIPSDFFSGLASIQSVAMDQIPFQPWTIPQSLEGCSILQNFSADSANVIGNLPRFFNGSTFPGLLNLHLAFNSLEGGLPDSFADLQIQTLWLNGQSSSNKLTGTIDVIKNMTNLKEIWLHSNAFSGPIPDLSGLTSLSALSLRDNQFTGPVPPSLTSLATLKSVNLTNNLLQGPTPLFPKSVDVDMSPKTNSFCLDTPGVCDPRVDTLLSVASSLGYPPRFAQNWKGNDPCSQWQGITCINGNITVINFGKMNLTGTISPDFASFTSLQKLILSNNNLFGPIPKELTTLPKIKEIDVSNNQLSGQLPSFGNGVTLKYDRNPDIGSELRYPPPPGAPKGGSAGSPPGASPGNQRKGGNGSTKVIAGSVVAAGLCLLLIGLLGFCLYKKKKTFSRYQSQTGVHPHKSGSGSGSSSDPENPKNTLNVDAASYSGDIQRVEAGTMVIPIQVLRNVTNNFSEENILGRGGFGTVYKGELHDGTKIAVKRMESGVITGKGLTEFKSEIAVLTKVRHRHLVALLGYCLEGAERLLVYEYMPQGTLSEHLFYWKDADMKPLEWSRRLSIALDVARGVEYLHGLAHQSFIHRDLKPSNILLGDDMRAKVADFGLVRLAPEGKASVETRLAGTFGYLAPEYAVTGRVTTKVDVYSFGVILMELITGRKALEEREHEESMHLVSWFRRMHINKDTFSKAIDPTIDLTEETVAAISTVAELAGHCSAREPYQRPDMGHVVNVLSSLVELWKPTQTDSEDVYGIDLDMTLPQALKKWQAFEGSSRMDGDTSSFLASVDNTQTSIPTRPSGFADSFTSADGR